MKIKGFWDKDGQVLAIQVNVFSSGYNSSKTWTDSDIEKIMTAIWSNPGIKSLAMVKED